MVFPTVSRSYPTDRRVRIYALLSLSPRIRQCKHWFFARLACLIHAANVHSEPGSNPSIDIAYRTSESLTQMSSKGQSTE